MKKFLLGIILLLSISVTAEATLIGDVVTIQRSFDGFSLGTKSVTVVPEIELFSWNSWLFDLSDYSITMDSISNIGYSSSDFNGFIFSDLDFGSNEIISAVVVNGIDQNRVIFSDHSISLDFEGLGFSNTQSIDIEIITAASSVPEPTTMILFGTGLIGLFGKRIWRKSKI